MKICRLARPPLRRVSSKFPQREYHILKRLQAMGHEVCQHSVQPPRVHSKYLSYGLGMLRSVVGFSRSRADVLIGDNLESLILGVALKRLYGTPLVFDFIDDYALIAQYDGFRFRYQVIRFLERVLPLFADKVIVVDQHKWDFCDTIGVRESRRVLIPNGTDTSRFRPDLPRSHRLEDLASLRLVVFVGRLEPYYGVHRIIESFPWVLRQFPDARLCLIGEGSQRDSLRALARSLTISNEVFFFGFVPSDEIPSCIASASVCVFGLPDASALILYEYMSCAKSVVLPDWSTEKMGVRGDILPSECMLMTENSPHEMAKGIARLLNDWRLRERMGKKARQFVVSHHGWDHLASSYESALLSVC